MTNIRTTASASGRMRTLPRRMAPLAALVTGLGSAAVALAPAAHADTNAVTYLFSGTEQTFVVPGGVTSVHVAAVGGRGGGSPGTNIPGATSGGSGATTSADLDVTANETLYIEVAGNGTDGGPNAAAGGFNGGGGGASTGGAGGGGASDVRTESAATANSLASRLLVAAGGGGAAQGDAGGSTSTVSGSGQPGADPDPNCDPTYTGAPGGGADQTSPGSGGAGTPGGATGSLGAGGNGGSHTGTFGGGGGGAGWYGGGGGGAQLACGGAGGGGSSNVDSTAAHSPLYGTDSSGTPRITISYVVPLAPQATTEPASGIGQTSATLNGVVTPEGFDTGYHFDYGTDPNSYSNSTPETQVSPTDSGQHDVPATITGLSAGTVYHFRLVATNANGSTPGGDRTFTTTAATVGRTPSATTQPATAVGWTKATLHGVVNPRGAATTYSFQYGTTTAYGRSTPTLSTGSGTTNKSVQSVLSGLARHTTYHFRLVATNANGTAHGIDRTFRTG